MKNYITQFWQFGILESAEAEDNLRHRLELAEYGLAPTGLTVLIVHIYWYYLSENHHRLNRSIVQTQISEQPSNKFVRGTHGFRIDQVPGFRSGVYSSSGRRGLGSEELLKIHSDNLGALDWFIEEKAKEAYSDWGIDCVHVVSAQHIMVHLTWPIDLGDGVEPITFEFPEDWWLAPDNSGEFSRVEAPDIYK